MHWLFTEFGCLQQMRFEVVNVCAYKTMWNSLTRNGLQLEATTTRAVASVRQSEQLFGAVDDGVHESSSVLGWMRIVISSILMRTVVCSGNSFTAKRLVDRKVFLKPRYVTDIANTQHEGLFDAAIAWEAMKSFS